MNKSEKTAIQSLRKTLQRKAQDAQTRSHEANWNNNPTDASFYDGALSGYLYSIAELDTMFEYMEKE